MSEVSDAFMKGIISGFTGSMDRDVSNMATKEATTPGEAAGDGEGRKYQTGPNSGVRYSLPNSTRGGELMYMLAHTANAYLDSGDMGKAMNVGSAAAQGLHNRNWRATQAAAMDAKGYDPQGIQAWIESGDNKDLVTGMGDQIRTIGGKNVRLNAKQAADYDQQQFSNNNLNAYQQAEVGIHQTELNQSQQRLNLENQSQAETVRHNYASEGLDQQRIDAAGNKGGNFNEKLGVYGYQTQLPSGETVFVHTNSKGGETKTGSNFIYDVLDENGNKIRTETGPMASQGAAGKNLALSQSAGEAMQGLSDLAGLQYNTGGTAISNTWNNMTNTLTGNQSEFQSVEKQTRAALASALADRAVSSSDKAILKSDMELQVAQGGIISPNKKDEENTRIYNSRVKMLAGLSAIAAYKEQNGGKSPTMEEIRPMVDQLIQQQYEANPQMRDPFNTGKDWSIKPSAPAPQLHVPKAVDKTDSSGYVQGQRYTYNGVTKRYLGNGQWGD